MKFLISIVMVLLLVNLFAQAEPTPKSEKGAVGAVVDDSKTKGTVAAGDSYGKTMEQKTSDVGTVGGRDKCQERDAQGRCLTSTQKGTIATTDGVLKSTDGKPAQTTPANDKSNAGNAEKGP